MAEDLAFNSNNDLESFALTELEKLVRIPSVSFPGFDPKHLEASAEATAELLKKVGFQNVELAQIDGCFPYVLGEYIVDPKLPTLLLYAHHDVQPAGRDELWKSAPFEPTYRDGRVYGRGTADDKAGILVHAAALKGVLESEKTSGGSSSAMNVNLKVLIEGEEEVGSEHLLTFLRQNQKRLQADAIVVTDAANIKAGVPSLTTSLRGLVTVEVEVSSLKAPLHSGLWGGGVVDPVQILAKMIASLTDSKGRILLKSIGRMPKGKNLRMPLSRAEFSKQAGVLKTQSVPKDFLNKIWNEPSLSVNAIQASSEKLANNIVCDRAYARIGIRVTPREKAKLVHLDLVKKLRSLAPSTVEVEITEHEPSDAWFTDPHAPKNRSAFQAAEKALKKGFGTPVAYIGCGASIPFIAPFEQALKAPVICMGVEDPGALAHSENESLYLSDFFKTIAGEMEFFRLFGRA